TDDCFFNSNISFANFNSTLVRLTERLAVRIDEAKTFQFHLGAINRIPSPFIYNLFSHFNSTLVRLTVFCYPCVVILFVHFNSTLVRLTEDKMFSGEIVVDYFNSTLVRLTEKRPVRSWIFRSISIPPWCD